MHDTEDGEERLEKLCLRPYLSVDLLIKLRKCGLEVRRLIESHTIFNKHRLGAVGERKAYAIRNLLLEPQASSSTWIFD